MSADEFHKKNIQFVGVDRAAQDSTSAQTVCLPIERFNILEQSAEALQDLVRIEALLQCALSGMDAYGMDDYKRDAQSAWARARKLSLKNNGLPHHADKDVGMMPSQLVPETLKNCPFCGGEAHLEHIPAHEHHIAARLNYAPDTFTVECLECRVGMCRHDKNEIVAAWNARPVAPHGGAVVPVKVLQESIRILETEYDDCAIGNVANKLAEYLPRQDSKS